jgi:hypothetical protein
VLNFLDITFTILHLSVILFNLFAWIWKKTRRAHLIVAGITLGSWFILGIWYGWGYCFITDWQWQVKQQLGETNLPDSFVKYFADKLTGKDFSPSLVTNVTLYSFLAAIVFSVYVNFFRKKKIILSRKMK